MARLRVYYRLAVPTISPKSTVVKSMYYGASLTVLGFAALFGALLLPLLLEGAGTVGGAFGSIKLHSTPCLEQLEHGFSSSHCAKSSVTRFPDIW